MNVDQEMDCNRCYVVVRKNDQIQETEILLGMLILSIVIIHISMIPSQRKLNIPERKVTYSLSHMKYTLNVINDILKVLYWKHCAKYTSIGWFLAKKFFCVQTRSNFCYICVV